MASGYIRKRHVKGGVAYIISVATREPRRGEMRERERDSTSSARRA
jgi:guanylate kinase